LSVSSKQQLPTEDENKSEALAPESISLQISDLSGSTIHDVSGSGQDINVQFPKDDKDTIVSL
jgi:hypothetical protein